MGLAASQARLLTLTSRMNDLELKCQTLSMRKLRSAADGAQISAKYNKMLQEANNTKVDTFEYTTGSKITTDRLGEEMSVEYLTGTTDKFSFASVCANGFDILFKSQGKSANNNNTDNNNNTGNGGTPTTGPAIEKPFNPELDRTFKPINDGLVVNTEYQRKPADLYVDALAIDGEPYSLNTSSNVRRVAAAPTYPNNTQSNYQLNTDLVDSRRMYDDQGRELFYERKLEIDEVQPIDFEPIDWTPIDWEPSIVDDSTKPVIDPENGSGFVVVDNPESSDIEILRQNCKNSVEFFKSAIADGSVTVAKGGRSYSLADLITVKKERTLEETTITEEQAYQLNFDTTARDQKRAEAQEYYDRAINAKQALDLRIDMEMQNANTEYNAANTEAQSLKNLIKENVDRSFTIFG